MNKKNKMIIFVVIFIISMFILLNFLYFRKNKNDRQNEIFQEAIEDFSDIKNTSIMYSNDATINELKEEYKIKSSDDIYEINVESDGRKTVNIKADINYKIAFSGMIKNKMPDFNEIDSIYANNHPKQNGIWIYKNDRENILDYLNSTEILNSNYIIDENGYLKMQEKNNQTKYDKKIEEMINSNNQYIFNISSSCYMADTVTGNIIENPYNDLEEYQTYEYFIDDNKVIVFITENNENKLTKDDIFVSLVNLFYSIDTN